MKATVEIRQDSYNYRQFFLPILLKFTGILKTVWATG